MTTRFIYEKNYKKVLQCRRLVALLLALVGLLGLLLSRFLLPNSSLSAIAQAFYRGASFGVLISSCAVALRSQWLLHHPERWKAARIQEQDERCQHITAQATQFAGVAMIFLLTAASFVLIAVNSQLAMLAVGTMGVYVLLYLAAYLWLAKRL